MSVDEVCELVRGSIDESKKRMKEFQEETNKLREYMRVQVGSQRYEELDKEIEEKVGGGLVIESEVNLFEKEDEKMVNGEEGEVE